MKLDPSDLQGNILRGYHFPHAAYLFVEVKKAEAGRRLLRELIDPVTTEEEWSHKPPWTLNVALTAAGLKAIGLEKAARRKFPKEFRDGMRERAEELGDVCASAPKFWDEDLGSPAAHLLLTVYAPQDGERDAQLARWRTRVEGDEDLRRGHEQLADTLAGAREHFGFEDGFSQPAVEGSGRDPRGEGVLMHLGRWRELRLGEFVLGHRDEDGVVPARETPLLHNGTFMVWRKLEQDVPLFRRWVREAASGDPHEEELIKAKIVGRWADGDSLVRSPDGHTPGGKRNRFLYGGDERGLRCPVGAHVRRANPRDALGWRTERSKRHRLLRRGMPYGRPLPDGATEPDGERRGLIFVCLNASIARQFELVQTHWLYDGDSFGLGGDRDFLLGAEDPEGKMTLPGHPPRFLSPQQQFVRTRGGEYLFVPGMKALSALAAD
jgi:Dyp-type peroxidase family